LRGQNGHLAAAPADIDHGPDVEAEEKEYDRCDVSSHAELSASELQEGDDIVSDIVQARAMAISSGHRYGSVLEDGAAAETIEEARRQAQLDYDGLVESIEQANDWIDVVRDRIDWSTDEVSHMTASAHNSTVVEELQEWKDSFEEVEPIEAVRFDENFNRHKYDIEVDLSPLRDMHQE
jgi:hypothetical protein